MPLHCASELTDATEARYCATAVLLVGPVLPVTEDGRLYVQPIVRPRDRQLHAAVACWRQPQCTAEQLHRVRAWSPVCLRPGGGQLFHR